MKFRNFKTDVFIRYMLVACIYPVFAYISRPDSALLSFLNAMTIIGIVFIVFGIIASLLQHGDFDIMEYITRRSANRGDYKSYDAYAADKKEKREAFFNYPLLCGIILLVISAILAVTIY